METTADRLEDKDSQRNLRICSLPYVDYLDEEYEAYALSLIEDEMETIVPRQKKMKLLSKPTFYNKSPVLEYEFREMVNRNRAKRATSNQYTQPGEVDAVPAALQSHEHAWKLAIRRAKIELEHRRLELTNLEIKQALESFKWMKQVHFDQTNVARTRMEKVTQKMAVDVINAKRKDRQEKEAASHLYALSTEYEELLQRIKNYSSATIQLKEEINKCNREDS